MPHNTRYNAQRQASQSRTTITAIWLHVNISTCSAVHSSSKIRSATATIRRLHGFRCSAGPLLIRYRLHSRQTLHIRGGYTLQCCPRPAAAAQPSMHLFGARVHLCGLLLRDLRRSPAAATDYPVHRSASPENCIFWRGSRARTRPSSWGRAPGALPYPRKNLHLPP